MHGLRLRPICLVARDQQKVVEDSATLLDMRPVHGSGDLTRFGLPAKGAMFQRGHSMLDALGVENLVFAAARISSRCCFQSGPKAAPSSRLMERRRGDTGYMIILQAEDVESYVRLGEQQGIRIINQARFPHYRDVHFHPKDTGGALLSVARHPARQPRDGPWYAAGQLPRSRVVAGLAAAELQATIRKPWRCGGVACWTDRSNAWASIIRYCSRTVRCVSCARPTGEGTGSQVLTCGSAGLAARHVNT